MNGKTKLDAIGLKPLRGINGSPQLFCTNSCVDLSAKVSLSASETANPTISSLQKANKIVRQAQRDDTLPIHIHSISLYHLDFGVLAMLRGESDLTVLPRDDI